MRAAAIAGVVRMTMIAAVRVIARGGLLVLVLVLVGKPARMRMIRVLGWAIAAMPIRVPAFGRGVLTPPLGAVLMVRAM